MTDENYSNYVAMLDVVNIDAEDYRKFLLFLDNARIIRDWHSPFSGFVLFVSNGSTAEIGAIFTDFLGGARFSISRVNSMSNMGHLSNETWDWMKQTKFNRLNEQASQ